MARFLGVTVMPEYLQVEGVDRVVANLVRMGATAAATSPYVMAEADAATGNREPPDDAGAGAVRLLDRPLWGRRELFVRTAPAFAPREDLYRGLRYQPPPPTDLTRRHGRIVADFVRAARQARLKVYLQVQAAIPPGYRVQFGGPAEADQPRLPDGRIPPRRLARNGSLAAPEIRAYAVALTHDLLREYPDIDGVRYDWPEYPPYFLDDVFLDFGPAFRAFAQATGFDFERLRREAADLYATLHGRLTDADLERWLDADRFGLVGELARRPGLADWIRAKRLAATQFVEALRRALTEAAGAAKELIAHAFPPPFALASGVDFAAMGQHVQGFCVKLYTMHWAMIVRFWCDALLRANPRLTESLVVRAVCAALEVADEPSPRLADWGYPGPEAAHPGGDRVQARKIRVAQAEAGAVPVYALAHGYGPVDDFRRRLDVAWRASRGRVWINRYGYLSDAKTRVVAEVCRTAPE